MSSWGVFTLIVLCASLTRGEYGDKVKSNGTTSLSSSENYGSSEEYYDDSSEEKPTETPEKPLTTPDDGVIIEKAILAAEITPKASYSLVDNPIIYDESVGNRYTQAKFGSQQEFFGFSSSDTSSTEVGNDLSTSNYPGNNQDSGNSLHTTPKSNSLPEAMQNSPQTYSGYQFPSWSFLGMYNIPSQTTQNPFSASYRSLTNSETRTAKASDINSNGLGLSEDGNYDPVSNGDYLHFTSEGSSQQPWSSYSASLSPEIFAQLEQERQTQIHATQSYLKQVEAAQEYATKVHALQNALRSSFKPQEEIFPGWSDIKSQETYSSPTTPVVPTTYRPKIVPKINAPGIVDYQHQNVHHSKSVYSPPSQTTASQVNALAGGGWMFPLVAVDSPAGFSQYSGPTASPVVLPSGFLADTEEVMQARVAHLQALMNAIESTSAWKTQKTNRWS